MSTIYLPSAMVSGQDAATITDPSNLVNQCTTDVDCPGALICLYTNASWMISTTSKFYQHDDVKGSNNYVLLSGRPSHNICGCSTVGGWIG